MVNKLKEINEGLIKLNKNNPNELKKYELIKKILEEDNCFTKIDVDVAYGILRDLKISEENIKEVYIQLLEIKWYNIE